MKEYSKYQKKIRICQILASAAAAATGFFLPFPMDGSRTCGVLLFGRMVTEMKFRSEYILLVVYILLSLLHLLRIFLLIRKKPIGTIPSGTHGILGGQFYAIYGDNDITDNISDRRDHPLYSGVYDPGSGDVSVLPVSGNHGGQGRGV
nr:hypothetical protein [uncultured Sellimonas sp.]